MSSLKAVAQGRLSALTDVILTNPTNGQVIVYENGLWVNQDGGGGSGDYTPQGVTGATVGGIAAGTDLGTTPIPLQDLLDEMLYPYLSPAFSAFSISGQNTAVEVGTTISGSKSFTWAFSNSGNVAANTMDILDVSGATTLASNVSTTSPYAVSVGSVQRTSPGNYLWQGRADNSQSTTFSSSYFTVTWYWNIYFGTSASTSLNEAGIEALTSSGLSAGLIGTYSFIAGNYKYFAWPDSFGSPTATTGFKDTATNLAVSMASVTDNPAFSNVQNGWYYQLVSVTNVNGITTNYRVYRTLNILGSSINIQVS